MFRLDLRVQNLAELEKQQFAVKIYNVRAERLVRIKFISQAANDTGKRRTAMQWGGRVQRDFQRLKQPEVIRIRTKMKPIINVFLAVRAVELVNAGGVEDECPRGGVDFPAVEHKDGGSFDQQKKTAMLCAGTVDEKVLVVRVMIADTVDFHEKHLLIMSITQAGCVCKELFPFGKNFGAGSEICTKGWLKMHKG